MRVNSGSSLSIEYVDIGVAVSGCLGNSFFWDWVVVAGVFGVTVSWD